MHGEGLLRGLRQVQAEVEDGRGESLGAQGGEHPPEDALEGARGGGQDVCSISNS